MLLKVKVFNMKFRKFTLNDPPIGADFGSKSGGIWAPDHFCSVVGGFWKITKMKFWNRLLTGRSIYDLRRREGGYSELKGSFQI